MLGWGSQHWQWQRVYRPQKDPSRKKGNKGSKRVKVTVYIPHVFCGYANLDICDGKGTTSEYPKRMVVIHSFLPRFWENGVFPNISINSDVTIISDSSLPNVNSWTLSVLRKEKNTCMIWQHQAIAMPYSDHWGTQDVQDTGPRELRSIWKEWFQQAQTFASSHI